MFNIEYEAWKNVCSAYFELNENTKKSYLQFFPLTKISKKEEENLKSESFFNNYIKDLTFVIDEECFFRTNNFLQKGDGSFRDSSLVSPILFLVLHTLGYKIYSLYEQERNENIEVYYAGNYNEMDVMYKRSYDEFYNSINSKKNDFDYYLKTDISNFFSNINVNILVEKIDKNCNKKGNKISIKSSELKVLKDILEYVGFEKFPTIENSVATSFLATNVYLDEIDNYIYDYISKNKNKDSFKMIRYVDDLYILFNSNKINKNNKDFCNELRNQYSSILKKYGLALNNRKFTFTKIENIENELKKSLYSENIDIKDNNLEKFSGESLYQFITKLSSILDNDYITIEGYNELINEYFSDDNIEYAPTEIFNYFIYSSDIIGKNKKISDSICKLIEKDISFISLDPKRLTTLVLKTKNGRAIRNLLNSLFERSRNNYWNTYDTSIAVHYLIQRGFEHSDLINVLGENESDLKNFYDYFCKNSFMKIFENKINKVINKSISIITGKEKEKKKTYFLYLMYKVEKEKNNTLSEFNFFKNYFDRVTAYLEFKYSSEKLGKPNFKKFYKEQELRKFYNCIDCSKDVLEKAHNLRNANPLSHASAELLEKYTIEEIKRNIEDLNGLIECYIENKENN